MTTFRLTYEDGNWELRKGVPPDELLELSNDLYWEGFFGESSWWLERWHETHENQLYWDLEASGWGDGLFWTWHDALLNVRQRLTDKQLALVRDGKKGKFEMIYQMEETTNAERRWLS